eukprot:UN04692
MNKTGQTNKSINSTIDILSAAKCLNSELKNLYIIPTATICNGNTIPAKYSFSNADSLSHSPPSLNKAFTQIIVLTILLADYFIVG